MIYFKPNTLFTFSIWHITQSSDNSAYAARLPEKIYIDMDDIFYQLVVDSHDRKLLDDKPHWDTFWFSKEFLNRLIYTRVLL
jgi:hypothetical protein